MSLKNKRQQVQIAAARLQASRIRLHQRAQWLFDGLERYRPALLVGGGFAAGLMLGRGKLSDATRAIVSTAGLGLTLLRSSFGTMLLARTFQRPRQSDPRADRIANTQG